jgi:alpha-amylase/alpha-mannosidase (GH57 family)
MPREGANPTKVGREFFMKEDDEAGIPWDNFVTALQVWSFMRPGAKQATVREAADQFGVTDEVVQQAVEAAYWMSLGGPSDDPTKQYIDHEGA